MAQQVAKDCVVSLRYVMRNEKGDVLEDTMQALPVTYLHGSDGILPLLQEQLAGLMEGDKKEIWLKKSVDTDDDFRFDVVIDYVRAATDEEVLLGYPLQIYKEICDGDCACYQVSDE